MVFLRPDYLHFSFTSKLFLKTGTWLFHCFLTWDEHDHKINQSVNLCNLISMVIIRFQLALQVCRKRSIVLTDHQTTLFHPLNYHALSYKYEALKINQTKSENKMSKNYLPLGGCTWIDSPTVMLTTDLDCCEDERTEMMHMYILQQ